MGILSLLASPLPPLLGALLAPCLPWGHGRSLALVLLLLAARATWHWWCRLSVTIDGVPFKEPVGKAHVAAARRAHAATERSKKQGGSALSPQDGGFQTPRNEAGAAAPFEPPADGLAARGLAEWAPFGPSLPFGEAAALQPPSPSSNPSAGPPPYWLDCDSSLFEVRNIRYKQTREKVPSEFALYDCVGMDMVRDRRRIDAAVDRLPADAGLPKSPGGAPEWSPAWGVPRVIVFNCQLPYKAGRLIGAHPEDDGGLSVLAYFVLSARSSELLARGAPTPSLSLLRRFVEEGVSTKEGISLKVVGRVEDLEKYEVPESFGRFNNKPVLLTKSATVLSQRLPEVMEVDYDVRSWVYLARSTLANYHHRSREAELEIGYLVEGKADDELPEQILGCFKLNNMDIMAAQWVSVM